MVEVANQSERDSFPPHVVFFLVGDSPASEFYVPTFWDTLFRLHARCKCPTYIAHEDGTDRVFRNVGMYNSYVGESPKRKNTTFRTRRKFEIMNSFHIFCESLFTIIPPFDTVDSNILKATLNNTQINIYIIYIYK